MSEGERKASDESAVAAVLADLAKLHAEIDVQAEALAAQHSNRLQCRRGCQGCCVDDLTVSRVEAERIRRAHPVLLASATPHAAGACAFLDAEGACRIYVDRPSVCRSQGLPLRFFFEDESGEIEEGRDICPLNQPGGPPVEELEEEDCWLIGPHEHRIGMLDGAFSEAVDPDSAPAGSAPDLRVALRSLFSRDSLGQAKV